MQQCVIIVMALCIPHAEGSVGLAGSKQLASFQSKTAQVVVGALVSSNAL